MAHFALLNGDTVAQVIVVGGGNFPESEPIGQAFIASLGLAGEWKQTSYSAGFRSKYAGIGDFYDAENDVFVSPATEVAE
ncbi:MAG: hypothetical protein EBS97_01520 [Verrucomicrobia bacterium]|nr:hypothetical protein [Verrucomicrobiota bacterium]